MANNIVQNPFTITTTQTKVADGTPRRKLITFTNLGNTTIYLGGNGVAAASAFLYPLLAGEFIQWTLEADDPGAALEWYAVVSTGTCNLSVGQIIA